MFSRSRCTLVSFFVFAILLFSGRGWAQTPALSFNGYTPNWEYTQDSYCIGWYFQTTSPISVNALGWYNDSNGLSHSHPVGIYDIQAGQYVASTTVRPSDPLTGVFRYRDLSRTLILPAGRRYAIVGVSFEDHYLSFAQPNNIVTLPNITFLGGAIDYTGGATQLIPPIQYYPDISAWPATNFKVGTVPSTSLASMTPETAALNSSAMTVTLTGTGFAANSVVRFNTTPVTVNSSSETSLTVTVPASLLAVIRTYNVTVTTEGRVSNSLPFRVTGNNQSDGTANLRRVGNWRTGVYPQSGGRYAVLLFRNQGAVDITTINFSNVRLYFDANNRNNYVMPVNLTLEEGATPPGTLINTPPGYYLQVRFDFPSTINGLVQRGTLSVKGTSDQGSFDAGSLLLEFP